MLSKYYQSVINNLQNALYNNTAESADTNQAIYNINRIISRYVYASIFGSNFRNLIQALTAIIIRKWIIIIMMMIIMKIKNQCSPKLNVGHA